ncbi:MAG: hypothetical protein PVF08_05080 [Gammaproteobacteria bacterium]
MTRIGCLSLLLVSVLAAGCGAPPVSEGEPVSFSRDVYPILQSNCQNCHHPPDGEGYRRSGLNLRTYKDLMRGTRYGPVVVPGDSRHSILIMLVEGRADQSIRMPHGKAPLGTFEIEVLRQWIAQGARNN